MSNANYNASSFRGIPKWLPPELSALTQFVCWRFEDNRLSKKPSKVPVQPATLLRASVIDPAHWTTYAEAVAAFHSNRDLAGIGFVFTADDRYCGIDFDNCFEDGHLKLWSATYVHFPGSTYSEISPSGNGIKFIVRAQKPEYARCKKTGLDANGGAVEIYDQKRFFTLTGKIYGANRHPDIADRQQQIEGLCSLLWEPRAEPAPPVSSDAALTNVAGSEMRRRERRCLAYIEYIPKSIQGEDGSGACLRAACETQRFGLDWQSSWRCLQRFNDRRCKPRWSSDELRHKLESAIDKVAEDKSFGSRLVEPSSEGDPEAARVVSIDPVHSRSTVTRIEKL